MIHLLTIVVSIPILTTLGSLIPRKEYAYHGTKQNFSKTRSWDGQWANRQRKHVLNSLGWMVLTTNENKVSDTQWSGLWNRGDSLGNAHCFHLWWEKLMEDCSHQMQVEPLKPRAFQQVKNHKQLRTKRTQKSCQKKGSFNINYWFTSRCRHHYSAQI